MKAITKDLLREIRSSFGRFLAIFSIALIGVAFYAGVSASPYDMRETLEDYFDEYRYMDLRVVSTIGFNEDDIRSIRETEGIRGLFAARTADVLGRKAGSDNEFVVSFTSIPDDTEAAGEDFINRFRMKEGRLPEKKDECIVRYMAARSEPLELGDRLLIRSGTEDPLEDSFAVSEFTVVGIVYTPASISFGLGTSAIGNGTVGYLAYAPESAFSGEYYTNVFLTSEAASDLSSMTDEYFDAVEPLSDRLSVLGKNRIRARVSEYKEALREEVAKKVEEEMTGRITREVRKAVREGIEKNLREEIETKVREEIETAVRETVTEKAREAIRENVLSELQENAANMFGDDAPESFSEAVVKGAYEPLVEAAYAMYLDKAVEEAMPEALEKAMAEAFEKNVEQIYVDQYAEVFSREYQKNVKKEVQAQLDEHLEEQIEEVYEEQEKEQLRGLSRSKWYVLDRNSMEPYVSYKSAANQMSRISYVFPVFFFFVAILVCFTTMTRMVDEQRGLIGTYKALGYSEARISGKYIIYALTASLLGSIAGLFAGMLIFPPVIYNTWCLAYQMPAMIRAPHLVLSSISVAAMTLVITTAAFLSCRKELSSEAAELMRPKAPKIGKKIFLEHIPFIWKHLSFSLKVTARNIFRYKKRFIMTLAGVAGCTALLVTGFGISDSVGKVVDAQYSELSSYTASITVKEAEEPEEEAEIRESLEARSEFSGFLGAHCASVKLIVSRKSGSRQKSKELSSSLTVFESSADYPMYFLFREKRSGNILDLPEEGILLSEHAASELGLKKGSEVTLENAEGVRKKAAVRGILENYVGDIIYMNSDYYESLFDETPRINTWFTSEELDPEDENLLAERIMEDSRIVSVSFLTYSLTTIRKAIRALKLITLVLILSSGLLSFVVLYNLANVNISERVREIATIEVLGFYDAEVYAYVYRENMTITVLGAGFGIGLGILLHHFIMGLVSMDGVIFGNYIADVSYLYSAALTLAFSLIVSIFVNLKLKKIPMVESLKSVE